MLSPKNVISLVFAVLTILSAYVGKKAWSWFGLGFGKKGKAIIVLVSVLGTAAPATLSYTAFTTENGGPTIMAVSTSGIVLQGNVIFGVYWDVTATKPVEEITWGEFEVGGVNQVLNRTVTIWVKNEGDADMYLVATWDSESWQPVNVSAFFILEYEFHEARGPLKPNRIRDLKLTLTLNPNITGVTTFSFDILLIGQDTPIIG